MSPVPSFWRRIAVICYDALLLLAVLFAASALALLSNGGQAFSDSQLVALLCYRLYLLVVSFIFYGWFWVHGGQTLGLRAWKLKLVGFDGSPVTWRQAVIRFLAAMLSWSCLGLGFLWSIFDKNRLCWHDYLSKTCLCSIKREKP